MLNKKIKNDSIDIVKKLIISSTFLNESKERRLKKQKYDHLVYNDLISKKDDDKFIPSYNLNELPIKINRPYVVEAQVYKHSQNPLFEAFLVESKKFPDTRSTESSIQGMKYYLKSQGYENMFEFEPVYTFANNEIAKAIMVSTTFENPVNEIEFNIAREIEYVFHKLGYFRCRPNKLYVDKSIRNMPITVMQFEPYYYGDNISLHNNLFHITDIKAVHQIEHNGIIPTHKNKIFDYPFRSYFFLDEYIPQMKRLAISNNKVIDNEIAVIEIDVSNIPEHILFFLDPLMIPNRELKAYGVYTYDKISKEFISNIRYERID